MAKDKERTINPAQAQRKAEKAKALKKSRSEQQARRNEKLARRNPDRIQRQIDDLKALEVSGEIKTREKDILADLERDLKAINKAREALGDKAPHAGSKSQTGRYDARGNANNTVLGKRRFNGERKNHNDGAVSSSGSDTDESVRNIPMPRDTPPPMPREQRRNQHQNQNRGHNGPQNTVTAPVVEQKTTYSAAPQLRDLKKEAISKFVPDVVRRKQDVVKGQAGLLEPEELDKLEQEGYYNQKQTAPQDHASAPAPPPSIKNSQDLSTKELDRLRDEEERFQKELAEGMDMDVDEPQQEENTATHVSTSDQNLDSVPLPDQRNDESEDDDDEDGYLPAFLSGSGSGNDKKVPPIAGGLASSLFAKLPKPQSSSTAKPQDNHVDNDVQKKDGNRGGGGLFSTLPKPHHQLSKTVEIEEVEDEDL